MAIDDHARIAYTELYPDESQDSACRLLAHAYAYYCSLVDGRPLTPAGVDQYRVRIGVVLQDDPLFAGAARQGARGSSS